MKIRSAVPENGFLVFLWRTEKTKSKKKTKKNKKTSVKHIRIRLIGGCVNYYYRTCVCVRAVSTRTTSVSARRRWQGDSAPETVSGRYWT